MSLAYPQPKSVVTRLEGFLPKTGVKFDKPVTEPVKVNEMFVPIEDLPLIDHLITEDDNPVDNIPSSKQQRLLVEPLYSSWAKSENEWDFLADANIGMFYAVKQPPLVPDMFLSLDVKVAKDWWEKEHRSYFFWEFGKPPEVVIEIVSNQEGEEDGSKLRDYARMGVRYYVIFDPQNQLKKGVLRLYELRGTKYVKKQQPWFPEADLGLTLWTGTYEKKEEVWLRWCDKDGKVIPTGAEGTKRERQRAEQERQRADREHQRAEQECQRAEQERQRAEQERQRAEQECQEKEKALFQFEQERQQKERLLAKLRALGIELDGEI